MTRGNRGRQSYQSPGDIIKTSPRGKWDSVHSGVWTTSVSQFCAEPQFSGVAVDQELLAMQDSAVSIVYVNNLSAQCRANSFFGKHLGFVMYSIRCCSLISEDNSDLQSFRGIYHYACYRNILGYLKVPGQYSFLSINNFKPRLSPHKINLILSSTFH